MALRVWLILSVILVVFQLQAQIKPTILYGCQPDAKGVEVKVLGYSDFISKTKQTLGVDTVKEDGTFGISINITETQQVVIPYGIFSCVLCVEPEGHYQIMLPEFRPKTMAEFLNPYFEQAEVIVGVKDGGKYDVNELLKQFDEIYSDYLTNSYGPIFKNPIKDSIDFVISNIEKLFDTVPNSYFYNYRKYKYAYIKYASYMRDSKSVVRDYYSNQPFLYHNSAFMDLFNQIYTNYFSHYMLKKAGLRLHSDVAQAKSPYAIKQTLENSMVLSNDTLQEMVMLKGLHDAFNSPDFPSSSLFITLDSVALSTKVVEHKKIAEAIHKKMIQAKEGYAAPKFKLLDKDSVIRSNADYLSNYVYLNFCSIESFACQEDFDLLKDLHKRHKDDVQIISISIDEDFNKVKKYFKERGYQWTLLSYKNQPNILKDYKVRAYPEYYLINPKGKLIMSPSVSPKENFEWYLFKELRNQKRNIKN